MDKSFWGAVKTFALALGCISVFASCHESLEDRAEREAKEFTQKFCPTPPENGVITDSIVFNKATRTRTYHYTFVNELDNEEALSLKKDEIVHGLLIQIRSNPQNKSYIEAGFAFSYVCRSESKGNVILSHTFTSTDLQGIK